MEANHKSSWCIGITVTLTAVGLILGIVHISFPYRISEFQSRIDAASAIGGLLCSLAAIVSASTTQRICGTPSHLTNIILIISRVIAVIGILLGLAVSMHSVGGASIRATRTSLIAIDDALTRYHDDTGVYPTNNQGLEMLFHNSQQSNWRGPYLMDGHIPKDAWGNDLRFRLENGKPILYSNGPDGVSDTADDIRN